VITGGPRLRQARESAHWRWDRVVMNFLALGEAADDSIDVVGGLVREALVDLVYGRPGSIYSLRVISQQRVCENCVRAERIYQAIAGATEPDGGRRAVALDRSRAPQRRSR
jgi:hypothetical protein